MRAGFGNCRYIDILNDIFKNPEAREVFEQMAKGGSIRMDERFLREIFTGGFLFGGVLFGFWGFSPFRIHAKNNKVLFGDSHLLLSQILSTLKDRIKTGLVKTARQVKGFWDSIGSESGIEDKRGPNFCIEITPEEASHGTTKIVSFKTQEGIQKYRIKIPSGIKNGVNLKIIDQNAQPYYLTIKIVNTQ
jgi:hypothetical protein